MQKYIFKQFFFSKTISLTNKGSIWYLLLFNMSPMLTAKVFYIMMAIIYILEEKFKLVSVRHKCIIKNVCIFYYLLFSATVFFFYNYSTIYHLASISCTYKFSSTICSTKEVRYFLISSDMETGQLVIVRNSSASFFMFSPKNHYNNSCFWCDYQYKFEQNPSNQKGVKCPTTTYISTKTT